MSQLFTPKQALAFDGALLQELQGNVTDTIARDVIASLPALDHAKVVHDNGCGYGAVTMKLIEVEWSAGGKVYATDVNPIFLAQLSAKIAERPDWPIEVQTMDACNLTFPDETFHLSFTFFVFAGLADDVAAASHIYRTLKPAGTAVITVWNSMPWVGALLSAHYKTRGAEQPVPPFLSKTWYMRDQVEAVTKKAGFLDVRFEERDAWLNLGSDLRRWARIAWTFLAAPVGGWQQRDEERWEEALDEMVEELKGCGSYRFQDGVHQIRMVADVVIAKK
jgi:SAM-dependent methyltransferase